LRFELTKLKNEKHILEENLDSIGKFSEERRGFRKQLSDKDIENSQFKDRITSLEGQLTRIRSHNDEIDKSLKEKCNSIKLLERDFNIIAKENGILMGDISDK
jgi:chromosome segregation ATPase